MPIKPVTVYQVAIDNYDDSLLAYLTAPDQDKAAQYKSITRKKAFVSGRALLAYAVAKITSNKSYCLDYSDHGKPLLTTPNNLYFNLSHSANTLCLAIAKQAIGIDCEALKPRPVQAIADFIPNLQISALTDDPLLNFYIAWTRYEATVKLNGESVFSTTLENPTKQPLRRSFLIDQTVFSIATATPVTVSFVGVDLLSNQQLELTATEIATTDCRLSG